MADHMTRLRTAGPAGMKKNLVIMGDGFAAADQQAYNDWVRATVIEGVFGHDYFAEDASAWNISRINLESVDSGTNVRVYNEMSTTSDSSDDVIVSTTTRNTSLDMIFSGSWAHCWMEYGAATAARIEAARVRWVPEATFILIVLNNPGFGGCGGDGRAHVSMGVSWDVIAHEFGHGLGGLGDEYCRPVAFTGTEADLGPNLTTVTNRIALKWNAFVDPVTPIPTGTGMCAVFNAGVQPADWDSTQSVGLFEGGRSSNTGVFRPALDCRMNTNAPPYCPVCYTTFKRAFDSWTGHSFGTCYVGDFNGDGRSDALIQSEVGLQVFRPAGDTMELVWSVSDEIDGWRFGADDQLFIGDFDGDGKDEIVLFNAGDPDDISLGMIDDDGDGLRVVARQDGGLAGWGRFARHDTFVVADFDGDGRDDLYIYNGQDWDQPYVGMLRSDGSEFALVKRFDGALPAWGTMGQHDVLMPADFAGDGKVGLYVVNTTEYGIPYLAMIRSTGDDLQGVQRFDGVLPGWGTMEKDDQVWVADFDGDGKDDLYLFNGLNHSVAYLGMVRSTGSGLEGVIRYDGVMPGWEQLAAHDRFIPADVDGSGRVGMYVVNSGDWDTEVLGRLPSQGTGLDGNYVLDFVGEWNLGPNDRFEPCSLQVSAGQQGLFAHNQDWFGVLDGSPSFALRRAWFRWIHTYRYGRLW